MKYELWYSELSGSGVLLAEGDQAWDHLKGPDAKVVWSGEADSYDEARAKRDEFCARSGFQPHGPRSVKESTTRLGRFRSADAIWNLLMAAGMVALFFPMTSLA